MEKQEVESVKIALGKLSMSGLWHSEGVIKRNVHQPYKKLLEPYKWIMPQKAS